MEPVNATVHFKGDSCEVWTGTQILTRVQSEAANAAGLPVDKVIANNHLLGGGFGRKLEPDMVVAAVRVAKEVDGPVKVVWTREEDIRHDVYRPAYRDSIAASLSNGKIVAWKYKVAGSSVMARWLPPAFQNGIDIDAVDSAIDMPYDIPNFHVEYVRAEPKGIVTGFWRGVGPNNNVFAIESFMDELARKAGKDPVEFRRGSPRSISPRKNPAGVSRCRPASDAASACSPRSRASSQPSWRPKSTSLARCICAESHPRSTPALRSILIRSRRSSKAA
jgi:isoquinoline 1-oxidoreductase beta subunit